MGKKGKGKAPNGRAGAKQKAQRAGSDRSWAMGLSRRTLNDLDDDDDDDPSPRLAFKGFAQSGNNYANAPRNFSLQSTNVKLRNQAITFVSAGMNAPIEIEQQSAELEYVAEDDSEDGVEDDDDHEPRDLHTNIATDTTHAGIAQLNNRDSGRSEERAADEAGTAAETVGQAESAEALEFIVDTVGDASLEAGVQHREQQPIPRNASPAPSDSSEEVVVFHGRNKPVVVDDPINYSSTSVPAKSTPDSHAGSDGHDPPKSDAELTAGILEVSRQSAETPTSAPSAASPSSTPARGWAAQPSIFDRGVNPDAVWAPAPAGKWWNKGQPRPDLDIPKDTDLIDDTSVARPSRVAFVDPGADAETEVEETVASLQAGIKKAAREKRLAKQLSLLEGDEASSDNPKASRRRKRGRKKDNRTLRNPIEDDDDDDASGEAAYDDYMANLVAQLDEDAPAEDGNDAFLTSAFARSSGLGGPSLVVDGKEIGDDEVLDSHYASLGGSSDESSDEGIIGQDYSEEVTDDARLNYSDLDSSELEDELDYTVQEQWEDEEDLRRRRQERMTDEHIARLLAKQQELGIDGDDLVIDDGAGVGDVDAARAGLEKMYIFSSGLSQNGTGQRRRSKRSKGEPTFPDASALADTVDQYGADGFDIMDFERPSLRPTRKGRKNKLPPELEAVSDDDLRETLRDTWETDRSKKRAKKQEREELRLQGLLGAAATRTGKANFTQKYANGMSTSQIHEELRIFLQDDGQQSRPFPPMDKDDRRALHEIANALNLKSLSRGAGKDRFPVLYKTTRTVRYSDRLFNDTVARASKGHLVFGRGAAAKRRPTNRAGAGGGFSSAAVGLRNGEIVGAGAAEIGKENFGHKLMEKMGWSKGMALGKMGEGRLMPVEQVMRAGKAGLG